MNSVTLTRNAPAIDPSPAATETRPLVLVIDDDPSLLDSLAIILEAFGFRVKVAEDGEMGLKAIAQEHPGVIVTDLHMPNLDGFGVMNELRRAGLKIPTIVMSGGTRHPKDVLLHCAQHIGAVATFEKPFSPLELMDTINSLPAFGGIRG